MTTNKVRDFILEARERIIPQHADDSTDGMDLDTLFGIAIQYFIKQYEQWSDDELVDIISERFMDTGMSEDELLQELKDYFGEV